MSLQLAAQHLASHGRGDDKVLVHMTRGELKSLNDLAMAGGGHLTINPHTGLHEAGFLRAMLPMIIGAGLAAATGGTSLAMSPAMIGAVVGGGYGLATGSVKQGLMAGLGAYGGAGFGSSLASSGTATGTAAAGTEAATAGEVAAEQAKKQAMEDAARNAMDIRPPPPTVSPDVAAQSAREYASNLKGTTADPFSAGTQKILASNPISTGFNTATSSLQGAKDFIVENKNPLIATGVAALTSGDSKKPSEIKYDADQGQRYNFQSNPTAAATGSAPNPNIPSYEQMMSNPQNFGAEQRYFNPQYVNRAAGGPVEQMSNNSMMGVNTMYPMANITTSSYGTPDQMATGGIADAHYNLGGYSDGGRLLRGPGDGVSDSIPAMIGEKQPARLADGEFVVPARIVSEIGNGSTEAGARKLYAMMDRVQSARKKTVGKDKIAHNSRADKYLPA